MKTSSSDPIRVDFLPVSALGVPGRVGMTFAPGKKAPGIGGSWDRDLDTDLTRLRDVYRAGALVSLVEDAELRQLGIAPLPGRCAALGIELVRFPFIDGGVPRSIADFEALVERVVSMARDGRNVVVHCRGGLGRTGLVAAACLVACGHAPAVALRLVRRSRRGAVETRGQERLLEEYAALADRHRLSTVPPELARFRGSLLGGALGDALGYPIEFLAPMGDCFPGQAPGALATDRHEPAAISDDTQMTLFVAEGLIRTRQRGNASLVNVVQHALLRWLATQSPGLLLESTSARGWLVGDKRLHARRAPGNTNLGALREQVAGGRTPSVERPPNGSKGCGAIMRSAPFGLAAPSRDEAFASARDTAVITHGHPSGYLAAAYFAALVFDAARGASLSDGIEAANVLLARERGNEEVRRAVAAARRAAARGTPSRPELESLGGGWVAEEALAIALACALTAGKPSAASLRAALWRAAAHSGDSDSTASLAGNLLGAAWGGDRLPSRWLAQLELRDTIERIAEDLHASAVLGAELDFESYPPN